MAETPSPSYREAMTELQAILDELERDDVDVDRLADRVARAAALIEICRARIDAARIEVERVVLSMAPDEPGAAPQAPTATE